MDNDGSIDRELRITALSERSSAVENILRHALLAELSSVAWEVDPNNPVNISKTEVDDCGYDIVLEHGGIVRHIQLKQTHDESKPSKFSVRVPFASIPGACVVVMVYSLWNLKISSFSFYGGLPDEEMPYIEADRATKVSGRKDEWGAPKYRQNYRDAKYSKFKKKLNSKELYSLLFPTEDGAIIQHV